MFERRLKIFLVVLFFMTLVLIGRAMQLQVFGRDYWRERAGEVMRRSQMVETTRGRILDHQGRPIAVDKACIDACVDYRAITTIPDEAWVTSIARRRIRGNRHHEYHRAPPARREQLLKQECELVKLDIRKMWQHLANVSGKSPEEIEEIRSAIARKVQMRRRYVWYYRFKQAERGHENREPSPWYKSWLIDDQNAPELDQFAVEVAEQTEAHVILRAISIETNNELGKNLEHYPGLELRPSTHRVYPYAGVASHILGNLSRVTREDLERDPHIGNDLRAYQPNDLIGRAGLEALCERLLRGQRGFIDRSIGENARVLSTREPVPGMDVQTTIDIELQRDLEQLFTRVKLKGPQREWEETLPMPGAAVVIDVKTNEIRAMASYPSFDLNELDQVYEQLVRDDVNRPLMNRATQFQLEPGSTVKPIVGLAAITEGIIGPEQGIECTGFLVLNKKVMRSWGRCWVASQYYEILQGNVAHHPIPWEAPHPTGHLTFADAIERSCNVYFETLADRLKVEGIVEWFGRFGLGRPTGVGIAEAEGHLPDASLSLPQLRRAATACLAGIGQDQVLATPLQMANVAATIARGGVWMRPLLVPAGTEIPPPRSRGWVAATAPSAEAAEPALIPERVDLKLSPLALAALRRGMINAVNGPAGTGRDARRSDMLVAGKTGTATASLITYPRRDEVGRIVKDENGRIQREVLLPLGTHAHPRQDYPWYRATGSSETARAHAWFIGFAPADRPQVAFAVMVEYGGSGGTAAGGVVRELLDACIKHGYLSPGSTVH